MKPCSRAETARLLCWGRCFACSVLGLPRRRSGVTYPSVCHNLFYTHFHFFVLSLCAYILDHLTWTPPTAYTLRETSTLSSWPPTSRSIRLSQCLVGHSDPAIYTSVARYSNVINYYQTLTSSAPPDPISLPNTNCFFSYFSTPLLHPTLQLSC